MNHDSPKGMCSVPIGWKWIVPCIVLAALIRCANAPRKADERLPPIEVVTFKQLEMPHVGPSKAEIQELHLDKFQQLIDGGLMPRADSKTRDELISIRKILDRVEHDGTTFLANADNDADFTKAFADMTLITGALYPDYLDLQVQVPSTLLMTVNSLEMLRDIGVVHDVGPDIARYKREALKIAKATVVRFPDAGRAYGELAFVLSLTGGSREEMKKLVKRCIELDSSAQFCKDNLSLVSE